ncbi:hypothetical protein IW261DRAFT_1420840 [Armillaria novae-zelandiae]|uniref:F-box domain-containing protein n=1 Tax=Armillaria novae-zelandiae TaxID=153914 RepID=A0AA39P567_9AGAR|nr:hypothetical protein IW261DRAFT_1420840 [Armillaria novae-zelandiae]
MSPSFIEGTEPSLLRAANMPTEIWHRVFSHLEYNVWLLLWGVCTWWCNILTSHTHVYLILTLPDHWTDIVPFEDPEELATFLQVFAMETEIDISATVVKCNIVVCGVHFRNWPVFPYNFFLHLCLEVETVIFEDHGSIPYMTPYKKVACVSVPACITDLFQASASTTLKSLMLDILRDPYGIQIALQRPQLGLTGGFMLVHQLFQSELGRLQYGLFVGDNKTFPLQTRVCCLEELNMCIRTQYYGNAPLLWPRMAWSLTTLTIQISKHHSGGSVTNINLNSLAALSMLNVFSAYRGVYGSMQMISTWASSCKELPTSLLNLNLEITDFSGIHLGEIIGFAYMRRKLDGDDKNNGLAFRGTFTLALCSPQWIMDDDDYHDGVSLAAALLSNTSLGLRHAECVSPCMTADFGCVLTTPNAFGLPEYKVLTDLVDCVEAELSFANVIDAYNNRTHPYFRYLSSIVVLSGADGTSFYGVMLHILQQFKKRYPRAVSSKFTLPSAILPTSLGNLSSLQAPSRYSHAGIVFRMNMDWQFWNTLLSARTQHRISALYVPQYPEHLLAFGLLWSHEDPAPIRSMASDTCGMPPLLFQLFPEDPRTADQLYFLWDDKAFPERLPLMVINELNLRWTPHMAFIFPRVVHCTGNNLMMLCMFFWPPLQMLDAIDAATFSSVLCANKLNCQRSLQGRFLLLLRSPDMQADAAHMQGAADAIMDDLRMTDGMHAAIADVQLLY